MPVHKETRKLDYTPEQVFDLVADVGRYHEFLPWCKKSVVTRDFDGGFYADLVIGFKMFQETFTSKVSIDRPEVIHVDYLRGPLKYLHNEWKFSPTDDGGCRVDFFVDFEFRNIMLDKLIGALFHEAVRRMVGAFEERAQDLYGRPAKTSPKKKLRAEK